MKLKTKYVAFTPNSSAHYPLLGAAVSTFSASGASIVTQCSSGPGHANKALNKLLQHSVSNILIMHNEIILGDAWYGQIFPSLMGCH